MNTTRWVAGVLCAQRTLSPCLADRYHLQGVIGAGAIATVFRAWDSVSQQPCAIKLLRPGHPHAEELGRRLLVEARILAEVKHQHVVRLHDSGVLSDGTVYLAMELLAGRDLAHHLNESGPLPISLALTITLQVGKALAAAHHCGIVHRDIKPQNIIVCREGPSDQVHAKVIDFGLAKVPLGSGREHSDGIIIGSLEFLAPEATLGFSALVDARADQWALAVLAYRMLSGVLPFSLGPDPMAGLVRIRSAPVRPLVELRPDIPACVERVILRALSKDKELRFPNMEQFIHALNQAAESTGLAHITSTRSAGDD